MTMLKLQSDWFTWKQDCWQYKTKNMLASPHTLSLLRGRGLGTRLVMCMCKEHMALVDRHGQKMLYYDGCGQCRTIWNILRPVFHQFRQIHLLYKSFRCLDRPNWWFSCWQQQQWQRRRQTYMYMYKPITLPLAHVQGNYWLWNECYSRWSSTG